MSKQLRAYILCRFAAESSLYTSWMDSLAESGVLSVVVTESYKDWTPPPDAGIVITHQHYRWEEAAALRAVYEQNRVPTLVLADGILDYCNTWEHPDLADSSMFQPLLAHKIACIGDAQARLITSWGNAGKCEVVGMPRLDSAIERAASPINSDAGTFNLLVATATTPAFTKDSREKVLASLTALKDFIEQAKSIHSRAINVTWRLTDGLDSDLGTQTDPSPPPIAEVIGNSDAVITTPSTIYLESLIAERPTAIIDFLNRPQYVPAAWTISAADQINQVVSELANPPAAKMLFQKFTLGQQLQSAVPATERMIALITSMVSAREQAIADNKQLSLPSAILPPISTDPATHSLTEMYPANDTFKIQQVQRLQVELSLAIKRMESMPDELADKNVQISSLQLNLDESRRRVADVRARLFKLRKILGIGKENETEEHLNPEP